MNCKPGDMAFVIRSELGNLGRVVEVLHPSNLNQTPIGGLSKEIDGSRWRKTLDGFSWWVKSAGSGLNASDGKTYMFRPYQDSGLRPIRPGDLHETEEDRKEVTA